MGMGGQCHDTAIIIPTPEMAHNQLYRRLGGSKSRAGQVPKFSPNLGFDSRTFQAIATYSLLRTKRIHKRWSHL